jgi:hypothetical protein
MSTIGYIVHEGRSPAFVFDLAESGRSKVGERCCASSNRRHCIRADFAIREDGVVRLNPEIGEAGNSSPCKLCPLLDAPNE